MSILRNVGSLAATSGLTGALILFSSTAPSWLLSDDAYGRYSQFYVATSIGLILFGAGLNVAYTYFIGQKELSANRINLYLRRQDYASAALWGLLAIASWSSTLLNPAIIYGLGASVLFIRATNIPSIYLGKGDIHRHNTSQLLRPLLVAVFVLTWAITPFKTENSLYGHFLLASASVFIIAALYTKNATRGIATPLNEVRPQILLRYGLHGLASNLTYTLGQRGYVFIFAFFNLNAASGAFFLVLAFLEAFLLFPSAAGRYLFARASSGTASRTLTLSLLTGAIAFTLALNLFLWLTLDLIKNYGTSLHHLALDILLESIPLQLTMLALRILSQMLTGFGLIRYTTIGSTACASLSLSLGFVLIPAMGVEGAILSMLAGNLLNLIIVAYAFRKTPLGTSK